MRWVSMALTLTLALGMVASARADTTLSSPLLTAGAGNGILLCSVSNVNKKPIDVTVTLYDSFGNVAPGQDSCATAFNGVLPAGASCSSALAGGVSVRCTVTTSSSKVRAVFSVRDGDFNTTAAVPLTK